MHPVHDVAIHHVQTERDCENPTEVRCVEGHFHVCIVPLVRGCVKCQTENFSRRYGFRVRMIQPITQSGSTSCSLPSESSAMEKRMSSESVDAKPVLGSRRTANDRSISMMPKGSSTRTMRSLFSIMNDEKICGARYSSFGSAIGMVIFYSLFGVVSNGKGGSCTHIFALIRHAL